VRETIKCYACGSRSRKTLRPFARHSRGHATDWVCRACESGTPTTSSPRRHVHFPAPSTLARSRRLAARGVGRDPDEVVRRGLVPLEARYLASKSKGGKSWVF